MFTCCEFEINGYEVKLALPEVKYADKLYDIIAHDRAELAHFLPWAGKMSAVEDEVDFIRAMRNDFAQYRKMPLVILVNGQPAGMVDLHTIKWKNESAEIGYWLSQAYQKKGIMTEAVRRLVAFSFNELGLHQVKLLADHNNLASRAIAERLNFTHVALLKDEVKYHGKFCDMDLYTMIKQ